MSTTAGPTTVAQRVERIRQTVILNTISTLYVRCENTLLIRPDAGTAAWSEAADLVLLGARA